MSRLLELMKEAESKIPDATHTLAYSNFNEFRGTVAEPIDPATLIRGIKLGRLVVLGRGAFREIIRELESHGRDED